MERRVERGKAWKWHGDKGQEGDEKFVPGPQVACNGTKLLDY